MAGAHLLRIRMQVVQEPVKFALLVNSIPNQDQMRVQLAQRVGSRKWKAKAHAPSAKVTRTRILILALQRAHHVNLERAPKVEVRNANPVRLACTATLWAKHVRSVSWESIVGAA